MASTTDICNMALLRFGEKRIMDINENTKAARVCRLFFTPTRDEILRSHRWNFATQRVSLSKLKDAPVFGFEYAYQLPADCLRVRSLNERDCWEAGPLFEIEGDKLLTNEEEAQIRYIARVTDTSKFDALFVEAFSLKLAAKIVGNLTGQATLGRNFLEEYERVTAPLARRIDGGEGRQSAVRLPRSSRFVRARFGRHLPGDDGL